MPNDGCEGERTYQFDPPLRHTEALESMMYQQGCHGCTLLLKNCDPDAQTGEPVGETERKEKLYNQGTVRRGPVGRLTCILRRA